MIKFIMKKLILLFLISILPCTILFSQKAKEAEEKINFDGIFTARSSGLISDDFDYLPLPPKQNVSTSRIDAYGVQFPEKWILKSALNNAPQLLRGIVSYLQLRRLLYNNSDFDNPIIVPSCHRFILVGPPGSGKTTLAYAVAKSIGCKNVAYIPATSFLGAYRNQTGINISRALKELTANQQRVVIIIDELHKLFEHHASDHSDDSQTAAAFWLTLDEIQKHNPHAIIIGTANNVNKLPPEIKSRFVGKIIDIPMPDKKQKINAFAEMLSNDERIIMEKPLDKIFLQEIAAQMHNCSLRDLQLLIDTAKMIYYAEHPTRQMLKDKGGYGNFIDTVDVNSVILTKKHFQQALDQLKAESLLTKESLFDSDKFTKKLQNWSTVLSMATSIISLVYWGNCFIDRSFNQASYWFGSRGTTIHA